MWNLSCCLYRARTKLCEDQFHIKRHQFVIFHQRKSDGEQAGNQCAMLAWSLCVWLTASKCHNEKEVKPGYKTHKHFLNSSVLDPRRSLCWDMGGHSWDWMTCMIPISVPDLQLIQCSWRWAAGEGSQRSIASLNAGVFTNVLGLLHLCYPPRSTEPTIHCWHRVWCIIQQLQFILTVCISLGDINWHHLRSILISFSRSHLCSDESVHLPFHLPFWAKCIVYSF